MQGIINVCTELLHLHGHVYKQSLMFDKEERLAIRICCRSGSDSITGGDGKRYGCMDELVHDYTGLTAVLLSNNFVYIWMWWCLGGRAMLTSWCSKDFWFSVLMMSGWRKVSQTVLQWWALDAIFLVVSPMIWELFLFFSFPFNLCIRNQTVTKCWIQTVDIFHFKFKLNRWRSWQFLEGSCGWKKLFSANSQREVWPEQLVWPRWQQSGEIPHSQGRSYWWVRSSYITPLPYVSV